MRYKVVSIPWAADGTHELDWDAEVVTTLKEQSTHVKCVIQPAEAEGSLTRRTTAATLARTMMMVGHEFMVRPQRNISAGMHLSFFGGALGTRADSLKPGLLAQLPEGLLWRREGGSEVVFEVNAKNASSVVFSNSQGVSLVSSWTTKAERWGAATVSACLVIIGKRGLSGKWRAWIENHYRWIVWKLAAVSRQICVAP